MIVWVLTIVQLTPYRSEYLHSIHANEDSANVTAHDLEYQLSQQFDIDIEPVEVEDMMEEVAFRED